MGWSIGYDDKWQRDIGYGVPAMCDHPDCDEQIDRGLSYVCGSEPFGGEHGCGLHFCSKHRHYGGRKKNGAEVCERCNCGLPPFDPKPDCVIWIEHQLKDDSWAQWRIESPDKVEAIVARLKSLGRIITLSTVITKSNPPESDIL